MSIAFSSLFWNLIFRHASLFSSEKSARYSSFLFGEYIIVLDTTITENKIESMSKSKPLPCKGRCNMRLILLWRLILLHMVGAKNSSDP